MTVNDEVILSVLKLSRAMRRCPPQHRDEGFPPAVGRMLECAFMHDGVSSRELCELLDLRPSSLSELLSRAEDHGLLTRVADEDDRRIQHVFLTERGKAAVERIQSARDQDAALKVSCFSEEEKDQFIALCDKLIRHLESVAPEYEIPDARPPFPPRHGMPHGPGGPHGRPPFHEEDDTPGRLPPDRIRC